MYLYHDTSLHRCASGWNASLRQYESPFAFYDYLAYGSDEDDDGEHEINLNFYRINHLHRLDIIF
jgi:hypothetical protein